ncbi:hypothetical protein AWC19_20335 [Mycobacterium palustre]|uniref:Transmembrane alanine and glycine rich protein n=4 Tax=Mycobacterium palustre TaxID=153971 RepID=A0A1X1Z2V6_9MYCO|nr:LGFP repeat-containing protein [Mycobacterium palustre]ORW17640.1 hypothetical protein AWC19_20335 [Mycobacterium palustre]
MRKRVGRALLGMATTAVAAGLLAPAAAASPIGDAEAAMMAAWDKAGGDTSPLGARKGDVYPAGDGFALDFDGGKMFYTTDTGAKFLYGPILDKYESQGGPAASDLGFPTINEVPGLAGPDSRVATFSASDKPVIFWTPDHGAFVVRGALNAAWDKLGSSGGVLGAPVGDATYDGDVTSQKFSGGEISWSRKTKEFTTTPPALGDQLKGLQVPIDPTAAINLAWRAAGGASGPLGAKQGGTYPIGGDGVAQNFAGGKVFFSPATGANALESDVLAKYESLGGPVGSDLGFPIANESDGGFGTSSRSAAFSAADKPVIFWTRDHGAFVVRGAIKAAWDKLRGPAGKLGAPVGDQAVTGDVFSQQFTGGKISWNRAKNTFSTDPSNLAPLLSGLQVSGQNQPSTAAMPAHGKKFTWHWWWLLAGVPVLLLALAALGAVGWRRRRRPPSDVVGYQREPAADAGYEPAADGHWSRDDAEGATDHLRFGGMAPREPDAGRVSWGRGAASAAAPAEAAPEFNEGASRFAQGEEDPDAVDTDSIPVVSRAAAAGAGYAVASRGPGEHDYPEVGYDDDGAEPGYRDVVAPRTPPDVGAPEEAEPQEAYPEVAVPDVTYSEAAAPEAEIADAEVVEPDAAEAIPGDEPRTGRHAAADPEAGGARPGPAGRPTIHLPLDDPYQAPDGYPIKASARSGLYYTPGSELYHDTLAEIWLASEEVAQANGFIKAD